MFQKTYWMFDWIFYVFTSASTSTFGTNENLHHTMSIIFVERHAISTMKFTCIQSLFWCWPPFQSWRCLCPDIYLWTDQFLLLVSAALHTETEYREHSLHHNIRTSAWLTWLISRDGERREFGYWYLECLSFRKHTTFMLLSELRWDESQYWQWLRKNCVGCIRYNSAK